MVTIAHVFLILSRVYSGEVRRGAPTMAPHATVYHGVAHRTTAGDSEYSHGRGTRFEPKGLSVHYAVDLTANPHKAAKLSSHTIVQRHRLHAPDAPGQTQEIRKPVSPTLHGSLRLVGYGWLWPVGTESTAIVQAKVCAAV